MVISHTVCTRSSLSSTFSNNVSGAPLGLKVSDGKISTQAQAEIDKFKQAHEAAKDFDFLSIFSILGPMVGNGQFKIGIATRNDMLGFKVVCETTSTIATNGRNETIQTSLTIEIYSHAGGIGIPADAYKPIYVPTSQHDPNTEWEPWSVITGIAVIGLTVLIASNPEFAPATIPVLARILPATL